MEKQKYGVYYKSTIKEYSNWYASVWTEPFTYLKDTEIAMWILVIRHANMTIFEDGSFAMPYADIALELSISKKTAKRSVRSLETIGFIRSENLNVAGKKYWIDFMALDKLCNVLQKNPGIGQYLRRIMEDRNIEFIKSADVKQAKVLLKQQMEQILKEK
jgi:hypothetical protein